MAVKLRVSALFIVALVVGGCAVPLYRAHPDMEKRAKTIRTVVVLPPRIDVFQISAGGLREKMDEWSIQGRKNIAAAIEEELKGRARIQVRSLENPLPREVESNVEETYALFDAVETSVLLHTYGPPEHRFEEKIRNFDYTLGKEVQGLRRAKADVLILVRGVDHISSGGQKAVQAVGVLAGLAMGTWSGVSGGITAAAVALVDAQTGAVLWYNRAWSDGGYDLRDPAGAASFVKVLMDGFPIQ